MKTLYFFVGTYNVTQLINLHIRIKCTNDATLALVKKRNSWKTITINASTNEALLALFKDGKAFK